jgi:hypothetical protein
MALLKVRQEVKILVHGFSYREINDETARFSEEEYGGGGC